MKQVVLGFGLLIFALLILFQLARYSRYQLDFSTEAWIGIFSVTFLVIGVIVSRKVFTPKPTIIEKQIIVDRSPFIMDEKQLEKWGLSKRELEILGLINDGLSNQQIAAKLFVSENTIKKHVSNIFFKLDVERRTEAVKKAKELRIIA